MHLYTLQTKMMLMTAIIAHRQGKKQSAHIGTTDIKEDGLSLLQRESGMRAIITGIADGYLDTGSLFTDLGTGDKFITYNVIVRF